MTDGPPVAFRWPPPSAATFPFAGLPTRDDEHRGLKTCDVSIHVRFDACFGMKTEGWMGPLSDNRTAPPSKGGF